jgi:hypothetical protein
MHKLLLAASAALLCGASAFAQSPLTTTFVNNNGGSAGGGVYFNLVVNIPLTITGIDCNVSGTGSVDVLTCPTSYVGNETNVAAWTQVSSGTVNNAVAGAQTPLAGLVGIALAPGNYGMAFRGVGVAHSYTNGNGNATPGSGTNQTYTRVEMTLLGGAANNTAFSTAPFTPRVVNCNLHYSAGSGTVATASQYGPACYRTLGSAYELFPTAAANDLANAALTMTPTSSGGYNVSPGGLPFLPPGPGAVALALGDDSEVNVALPSNWNYPGGTTPSLTVCSNGFVSVASGNGTAFTPSVASFLGGPATGYWYWHDFNPAAAGSGQVMYEQVGSVAYITWNGVYDFGTTTPNTFQHVFDLATGIYYCHIWIVSGGGNNYIVGYSPGGTNLGDPGSVDLSVVLAGGGMLLTPESPGLQLSASARPITGTTINLVTSNVHPATTLTILLMNFAAVIPPIDLGFLGMPLCSQNIALAGAVTIGVNIGNGTYTQPFGIPGGTTFIGTNVFGQSAALVPGANPLGATSSNGLRLVVGNL